MFSEPSIGRIDVVIYSIINRADSTNFIQEIFRLSNVVPASSSEESVGALRSRTFPDINYGSNSGIKLQVALVDVCLTHVIKGFSNSRIESFNNVGYSIALSESTKSEFSYHPRISVHNSSLIILSKTSKLAHSPPVRVSTRPDSSRRVLFVFSPHSSCVV